MSKRHYYTLSDDRDDHQFDLSLFRPLISAADVGQGNHTQVRFDQHISEAMSEHAKRRAPKGSQSFNRHLVGIAGEVATGAWQRVPINTQIMPDYEGDDGYDLEIPRRGGGDPRRIEVKTTTNSSNLERPITERELEQADYFVLCNTSAPKQYVDIVGYAPRPLIKWIGHVYGRDEFLLSPEWLHPTPPIQIFPDDVRDAMYG